MLSIRHTKVNKYLTKKKNSLQYSIILYNNNDADVNNQSDTTLFTISSLCRAWSDTSSGDGNELCDESTQTTTDDRIYYHWIDCRTTDVGGIA